MPSSTTIIIIIHEQVDAGDAADGVINTNGKCLSKKVPLVVVPKEIKQHWVYSK